MGEGMTRLWKCQNEHNESLHFLLLICTNKLQIKLSYRKKVKNNIRGHYFGTSKIETLGRVVPSVISALRRLGEEDFKVGLENITRPRLNETPQEL